MNTPAPILNNTFNCIFQTDINLNIVYWNTAMEVVSGIAKKNAMGRCIFDLIPSLFQECEYYFREAILKEARVIELHFQKFTAPISKKQIRVKARYIPDLVDGKVIGIYGIWKQVHRNYEERDYLNMLESVILNTKDAVMITRAFPVESPDGPSIIYTNPAFNEMTGYGAHEVLGKTPRILQGEETDPEAKKNIRTALKNWQPIQQEILNYTKSGEKFWTELSIAPVKNEEGYFTHWISVQRDITEKRARQQELQDLNADLEKMVEERTKELEQFVYFASHDLKEPLRNIHSFLDLLKRRIGENLDETSIEYLDFVQGGAVAIKRMIEGLLSYSQVQKATLKLQEVGFDTVIHGAMRNLSFIIKKTNTEIKVGDMPTVNIDFSLMINVMQNLIANAIKYCDNPQPLIEISSEEKENFCLIKVKDNGQGINDRELKRIFNIFATIKATDNKQNSGIGLAICKNIVEKHKGKVYVESEEGIGSTFIIQIPNSKF